MLQEAPSRSVGAPLVEVTKAVQDLEVGDKVLSVDAKTGAHEYARVSLVPKSPTTQQFVRVATLPSPEKRRSLSASTSKLGNLRQATGHAVSEMAHTAMVTLHHTFPSCSDEGIGPGVAAKDLRPLGCVFTVDGKSQVESADIIAPSSKESFTYSVVLDAPHDRLFVGGVLSHSTRPMGAKAAAAAIEDKVSHAKKHQGHKSNAQQQFSAYTPQNMPWING